MTRNPTARRRLSAATRRLHVRRSIVELLEERTLFTLEGNVLFPLDNPWNQRVDQAPVATNSATLVDNIGRSAQLHPDFGTIYEGAYIGIPYVVVSGSQTPLEVIIDAYPSESDLVPVPIPPAAPIEGDPLPSAQNDGDRHLLVYDRDNNVAYELYRAFRPTETGDGKWHADSEAVWDMTQNSFRTPGDTSADAAGLPILPGLVRPDEVLDQGVINHALRFTVPRSRNQYIYPASHQAGSNNANYPRMGERFRLKASFDISGFSPENQVILRALKEYGMIVADNGSAWYLSGSPSSRWDDDDLHDLSQIIGSNFEAVDLTPITNSASPASGPTGGGTAVTIQGRNFSGAAGRLNVMFGSTAASSVTILSDTQLIAVAPPHAGGTVSIRVNTPYGTSSAAGAPTFTFGSGGAVVRRHLFYNQSGYDGDNPAINAADDAAIAAAKSAYLPGAGLAGFESVSSYARGINGLMIDLAGGGTHGSITANDFVFKVGNSNSPNTWGAGPAPAAVSVRLGAGVSGSDRVEITWTSGAIKNTWLEVQVLANARTGLPANDVFFFGSLVGDTGSPTATSFTTTTADASTIVAGGLGPAGGISNVRDIDKSNTITVAGDRGAALANVGSITRLNVGTGGPFAPQGDSVSASAAGDSGIASALAAAPRENLAAQRRWPVTIARSLATATPARGAATSYAQLLAAVALEEDDDDDARVDDDVLEALADGIRSEQWLGASG
ncbi:MAG: IPT/TIG domain-containing protein [Pirellulales bacterium]